MFFSKTLFLVAGVVASVVAKNVVINVGGNDTNTFDPQRVDAQSGDVVIFKFIQGNHSVTQSDFATPCIPIHTTNQSINGFDSQLRIGNNGSAATNLVVPITDTNNGSAIWFYDAFPGACGAGNVGVINNNETSDDNLAAFMRNAERLNGTDSDNGGSSSSFTGLPSGPSAPRATQSSTSSNDAARALVSMGASSALAIVGFSVLLF